MANMVTAREVGQYLKICESTVYKLAASGQLPGFRIGNSWRFDLDEIQEMIQNSRPVKRQPAGPGPL